MRRKNLYRKEKPVYRRKVELKFIGGIVSEERKFHSRICQFLTDLRTRVLKHNSRVSSERLAFPSREKARHKTTTA